MGHKTIERGYYWVKFYNHERKMILFYTGIFWEQFKHDDIIHDEIESYERVAEPSNENSSCDIPHVSGSLLSDKEIADMAEHFYSDENVPRWVERLIAFKKGAKWMRDGVAEQAF